MLRKWEECCGGEVIATGGFVIAVNYVAGLAARALDCCWLAGAPTRQRAWGGIGRAKHLLRQALSEKMNIKCNNARSKAFQ